jgi:hypothetical protein
MIVVTPSRVATPATAAPEDVAPAATSATGGPATNASSVAVASSAYAVGSTERSTIPGSSARMHAPTGGTASPARPLSPASRSTEAPGGIRATIHSAPDEQAAAAASGRDWP